MSYRLSWDFRFSNGLWYRNVLRVLGWVLKNCDPYKDMQQLKCIDLRVGTWYQFSTINVIRWFSLFVYTPYFIHFFGYKYHSPLYIIETQKKYTNPINQYWSLKRNFEKMYAIQVAYIGIFSSSDNLAVHQRLFLLWLIRWKQRNMKMAWKFWRS